VKGLAILKDSITGAYWLHQVAILGHAADRDEYNKLIYNVTIS